MTEYKISIDKDALEDIQNASDWYNYRAKDLGNRFQKHVKSQINSLRKNPLNYSVRYQEVRCILVKKFPFLIHFTVDENKKLLKFLLLFIQVVIPKFGRKGLRNL